jgi:hypothetical protein
MLPLAILSLGVATVIWHVADVNMLQAMEVGRRGQALAWVSLHVVSVPLFALSSCVFFRIQRAWWIVELPYLLAGFVVSALLFRNVLSVSLTWRELAAVPLILGAAFLVSGGR